MSKWLLASVTTLALVTSVSASAGASCNNIVGQWRGSLGDLTDVNLNIQDQGGATFEDAHLTFKGKDGGNHEFGLLKGHCHENGGQARMHLSVNMMGVNVDIKTHLNSKHNLQVDKLHYSTPVDQGSGAGTLSK